MYKFNLTFTNKYKIIFVFMCRIYKYKSHNKIQYIVKYIYLNIIENKYMQ